MDELRYTAQLRGRHTPACPSRLAFVSATPYTKVGPGQGAGALSKGAHVVAKEGGVGHVHEQHRLYGEEA